MTPASFSTGSDDDSAVDPLIGQTLGNCRLEEMLGRGAMGAVYRATQSGLERTVAVKVLWAELAANVKYVSRFERESRLIAQMRHPNVVDVYSAGVHGEHRYLVMEFVEGKPLSELIRERGGLPSDFARDIMLQAARGLEAAWSHGVIHRDIKPDNLLVTSKGLVKVADFGLAKNVDEGTDLTRVGQIMGTPLYMSPEQAEGRKADIRADIYALGISFWHALAGQPPYQAETALALLRAHVDKPLPDVRRHAPECSDAVWAVVQRMCAKDRENRYADPVALIKALEDPGAEVAGTVLDLIDREAASAAAAAGQTIEDLDAAEPMLPPIAHDAETIHDPGEPLPGTSTTTHEPPRSKVPGIVAAVVVAVGGLAVAGAIWGGEWFAKTKGVAPSPAPIAAPAPVSASPAPAPAPVAVPVVVPDTTEAEFAAALARAQQAIGAREWDAADSALEQMGALKPAAPERSVIRQAIGNGRTVDTLVAEAETAFAGEAWGNAKEQARAALELDGAHARAREIAEAAERQSYFAFMRTGIAELMKRGDFAQARAYATGVLKLHPNERHFRAARDVAQDALDAVERMSRAHDALDAGEFDDAEAGVQRARGLYAAVPGATELLQRIANGRLAMSRLAEARAFVAKAQWTEAHRAVRAAVEVGATHPDAGRIQALAERGIELQSADAELPHAKARAIRRLLPNGATLLVLPTTVARGRVHVSVTVRGAGSARDRGALAQRGAGALTRRLLSPASTARRSRVEARGMLQALDAVVVGADGKAHWQFGLVGPAMHVDMLVPLLAEWVHAPSLKVAEVHAVRDELRAVLAQRSTERWAVEWRHLSSAAWGAHPWAEAPEGTVAGLDGLTRRAIADYHATTTTPARLVITVVGDCNPAQVQAEVMKEFGLRRATETAPTPPEPLPTLSVPDRIQRAVPGLDGATVFFAWRTVPFDHADRPALDAAAAVLGRVAEFRLASVVAAKAGRTSQARHWVEPPAPGLFYIAVRCARADIAEVEQGMADAIHSLVTEPPTAAELRQATTGVQPALPAGPAALPRLTADLLQTTLHREAPAFWTQYRAGLRSLTAEGLQAAARNALADERRLTLVLTAVR